MNTLNTPVRTVTLPSYNELLASLPEKFHTIKVKAQLLRAWEWETTYIKEEVQRLTDNQRSVAARMFPFSQSGRQWIAEFWVKDLGEEETDRYNWHGQNVSQWVYAGAIVASEYEREGVSEIEISRHH